MKKISKIVTLSLVIIMGLISLTGCSTTETNSYVEKSNTETENTSDNKKEIPTVKVGETWVVEGQWKLTINSVKRTAERNEFEESNPEDVVYITYTYENIGYEDEYGISDGIYLDLTMGQIIDSKGELGQSYPNVTSNYPQAAPVGAKCVNTQVCVGLNNKSDSFTINFNQYDGNGNNQKVKFVLEVQ